jgi:hypothetical protein
MRVKAALLRSEFDVAGMTYDQAHIGNIIT